MMCAQYNLPQVSVVMPAYNQARFIGRTLDSLEAQTHQDWECVVVDDGSRDDTFVIVSAAASRDARIRLLRQENRGPSAARNRGLAECRGEFVQFLDADDFLDERKIEVQLDFLRRRPDVDVVYGEGRSVAEEAKDARRDGPIGERLDWMPEIRGDSRDALLALIRRPFPIHCALLRRELITAVGPFHEGSRACEDWRFWICAAARGKRFAYLDAEGTRAYYRLHPESACADRELMRAGQRWLRREVARLTTDAEARRLNQTLAAQFEGYTGMEEVKAGNLARGVGLCLRAMAMSGRWRERVKWLYCAAAAPFAPREQFDRVIAASIPDSLAAIARHWLRGGPFQLNER